MFANIKFLSYSLNGTKTGAAKIFISASFVSANAFLKGEQVMKFYKCTKCGQILEAVDSKCDGITCCGEPVKELKANTSDGALEKHVSVVEVKGNKVTVKVGSAEHPMQDDHWIQFIEIETTKGAQRKILNPGEKPEATFELSGEEFVKAYEFCNKHGLWANA